MSERQAYPLSWPETWPRTAPAFREHARFQRPSEELSDGTYKPRRPHSMEEACHFLSAELDRLGATKEILSTNVPRRLDGQPYSNRGQLKDPGAALYFEFKSKPVTLASDKWLRVEDNIWAIAKHIEALRGQHRWGVGSLEQAFRGYMALPGIGESSASDWWKTLGVTINASAVQVREAYRVLVKKHHPDRGGDPELFNRVQRAMERFEQNTQAQNQETE